MVYCCQSCGFLFRRMGTVEVCPCEGGSIRPATAEEEQRLQALLRNEQESRKGEAE